MPDFSEQLEQFADSLAENFRTRIDAQPEDQLKGPVQVLLQAAGSALNRNVGTRTEARVAGLGAHPDIGVAVQGLLTGHVELKAPGKGARPERYRGADREQWTKFQVLPNLLYTDGSEWALYRFGERKGDVVRLGEDLTEEGPAGLRPEAAGRLHEILRDFLLWEPAAPSTPRELGEMLAPLCRLLRDDVLAAAQTPGSVLQQVAHDWRRLLFAEATDFQFADAYAQTLTYALLLARFEGAARVGIDAASETLQRRHGLLAQTLRILGDPQVRQEIALGIELLERFINAVDPRALQKKGQDPWLYFYEDFLAAYDPKLRKDRGAYYTPVEVIRTQCHLVSQLLTKRFEKQLSFADDEVVLLDPAAGTGAYPLAAFQMGLDLVREHYGEGAVPGRASKLAENLHAFEILVGPYAVAHLRMTQAIDDSGGEPPADGVHVYLTDTLESPHAGPPQVPLPFMYRPLAEEHARARNVKERARVLVCMGNPPYDRQQLDPEESASRRKGGWVRFGDDGTGTNAILDDFLAPAREAGQGVHLKNLYNDYVYFWRWALWKVFETTQGPGIVSFITASSYLRGPGFVAMRQVMRQIFDELWILDLEGDSLGARKTENVFAIRTAVAIAVGVRYGGPRSEMAAKVRYAKLTGTREEKLERLGQIRQFEDLEWRECSDGWMEPFLAKGSGDYNSWPLLTCLFPWQHSGVQYKRTWPIGETKGLLERRWAELVSLPLAERRTAFKETRDRKINRQYQDLLLSDERLPAIADLPAGTPCREPVRYGYRSFDRQWAIRDARVGDFLRPVLWLICSDRQVFLTSLLTEVLGLGPAASVTALPPDLHHFSGRGAKDVIPLWRDRAATEPNLTRGLLSKVSATYGFEVSAEELFAYCYGLLASPAYVDRFSEELTNPGPRIPMTRDAELFRRTAALGRRLIWLQTYGERFVPEGQRRGAVPQGMARCTRAIPGTPAKYPEDFAYDEATRTLQVGEGRFTPVEPEVWNFSVSGLEVVKSWLGYRMKEPAGRASSPLDRIRPERWTSPMTEELLHLLWVLEATVALFPELERNLEAVARSEVFSAAELPQPADEEREPPQLDALGGRQAPLDL